jgi:parallel beta-helix repeat protein
MMKPKTAWLCAALAAAPQAAAREVPVKDTPSLARAIAHAQPGDDIVLANGTYQITRHLSATAAGTPQAPITVRAAQHWQAHILSTALVAFEVTGPNWIFRDLDVKGVCASDTICEHAVHVVGTATFFQLRDNRLVDFNAQLKVNADTNHVLPTNGLVAGNEIFDTHPRHTDNPVAPLDMDNASFWVARNNLIYDFQKDGGNEVAYGAYFKGGSRAPIFEHNVVLCSRFLPPTGQTVGLSLGAGGMDPKLCPPYWDAAQECAPEVQHGIVRDNIVARCSDDGIYMNNARQSEILSNTLIDTKGIEFRFDGSSGLAQGNQLTGKIRSRDMGHVTDAGNLADQPATRWACVSKLLVKLDISAVMPLARACALQK